jgi:hypothetical protein
MKIRTIKWQNTNGLSGAYNAKYFRVNFIFYGIEKNKEIVYILV